MEDTGFDEHSFLKKLIAKSIASAAAAEVAAGTVSNRRNAPEQNEK
ncbi:MAG: hypothetical protein ON057_000005 [Glomeribacter sp. 1016415]|nr:hypothetical protein [Glomeribacter sp. 1016415]